MWISYDLIKTLVLLYVIYSKVVLYTKGECPIWSAHPPAKPRL